MVRRRTTHKGQQIFVFGLCKPGLAIIGVAHNLIAFGELLDIIYPDSSTAKLLKLVGSTMLVALIAFKLYRAWCGKNKARAALEGQIISVTTVPMQAKPQDPADGTTAESKYAGTGKTTMLVAAREAFEKEGYRVLGCTVAANAAKTLERETGIASETLKMRFLQLNPAPAYAAKHEAKQLLRAFLGKDRHDIPRLELDKKTVVVLDEASMVGTRDFAKLIDAVHKAGSLLVCIGDKRQLPAIEAGGGFESICKRVGQAELTAVTRQRDELDRHAVKDLAIGKAEMALQHYARKGQLTVAENREAAEQALIGAWRKNGGTIQPKDHLILTGTKDGVARLNQLAQKERIDAGFVTRSQSVRIDRQEIHVGDRIICLKNARALGLRNGATGEVTGIKTLLGRHTLAVRLDGERQRVLIPLKEYSALKLGYAFTTHKAQGATVENAYVHVGERMTSRELSYVQGSRHKNTLQIFTDRNELRASSLDLKEIAATSPLVLNMNRSVKKEMAHEHLNRRIDQFQQSRRES
jgi:ATP-dependent exoDNAse (exonuclease V) alpha subunit